MTATTPAAFDPKPKQLYHVVDAIAGVAILAGEVVSFNATGVAFTVQPGNATTTSGVLGVALHSQATVGGHIAIAGPGSVIKVCEGAGSALDAGDIVVLGGALGCVISEVDTTLHYQIGVMLEDTAGNGTGYCMLTPPFLIAKGA